MHLRYPDQFTSLFEDEKNLIDKNIKDEKGDSLDSCKKKSLQNCILIGKIY
jgi:hypothetical protein